MELFGIRLLGINGETGHKLLLLSLASLALLALLVPLSLALAVAVRSFTRGERRGAGRGAERCARVRLWAQQVHNSSVALLGVLGLVSIWFDKPANLAAAMGMVTAVLAFALQKVVTSLAGYCLILRGKSFTVGNRMTMAACLVTWWRWASFRPPTSKWASRPPRKAPTRPWGSRAASSPAAS